MRTLLETLFIGGLVIGLSAVVELCASLFDMIPWKISMWFFLLAPFVMLVGYICEEIRYASRENKKNVH